MNSRGILPAAVTTAAVLLFAALYTLGYREQYASLLSDWGAAPFRFPFLDTHAVLSAAQCHRLGVDVYVRNPCDVFGRIHVYSPLWLWLSVLPITTAWTPVVGLALVALFLLSLMLLPVGRGWWQVGVIVLATLSGTVAFALERGNNDLVVFILVALVIRLVPLTTRLRYVGYALAVLAALLKFYPAVVLLTAVRERLVTFVAIGIVAIGVLTVFAAFNAHDLMRVLSSIPTTSCFDAYVFGARDLPCGLAQAFGWSNSTSSVLFGLLGIAMVGFAVARGSRGDLIADVASLTDHEATSLLVGCVLILACFFTAQNVLYRGIHFLFVMPALTALVRRQGRPLPLVATVLILLLMDWEVIRRLIPLPTRDAGWINFNVWLIRELIWWVVVTIMATLLLAVLAQSRVWRDLRALGRFFWQIGPFRALERYMRRTLPILLVVASTIAVAHAAPAAPNPSVYCDTAIVNAERSLRLPARLLGAIAEVESGRPNDAGMVRPWPWTINAEGRGQFFATKADAIVAVRALQADGVRSIDVGCMQVNLMYHPNAFASLDEAFDPPANALYAARFLNTLYGASGSWVQATAAYHSETPAIGADYQRRVMARWQMPGMVTAYRMFAPTRATYDDFQSVSRAYGDFAAPTFASARVARR